MTVMVSGASKGIGRELVFQFAARGCEVIALSSNLERLSQLQKDCRENYNSEIHIYSIDFLANNISDQLEVVFKERTKPIEVLINNAGLLKHIVFDQTSMQDVREMFMVNYFAPFQMTQKIIQLNNKGGALHVVNIGSMGGFQGSAKFPGLAVYSSSKAALANLTECLAEEYKDTNIRFNCLALGSVNTEMLKEAFPEYTANTSATEMAEYIAEFSLNGHKYYNGKVLPVSNSTP